MTGGGEGTAAVTRSLADLGLAAQGGHEAGEAAAAVGVEDAPNCGVGACPVGVLRPKRPLALSEITDDR